MLSGRFSAAGRQAAWAELDGREFEAVVIGGGITGSAIARELAGRGVNVALFEAGDLASGTSSRSSRLIHGGLRYLESFEFGLVFESLRERRLLLDLAPHLVRPLPFLFPVYRGESPGFARLAAGMMLYETLALFRAPRRHRMLGRTGALAAEPMLRADGLVGGAVYHDAQVDDARLTLAVARAAHDTGALILSYSPVVEIRPGRGQAATVVVRDRIRENRATVRARLVVNAAGPWSDRVRRLADPAAEPKLRRTKGVHILVERERVANRNAVIFRSPVDDRVMFVLPWGRFTYVGTTDTEYAGDPADVTADTADVAYLIESANAIYPRARLTPGDILSTWAGVRPLIAPAKDLSASATSREHLIWRDAAGLLNVAGGKLTTFRSMAAEAAETAAGILARESGVHSGTFESRFLPLPGAPDGDDLDALADRIATRAGRSGVDGSTARAMVRRYGTETDRVLDLVEGDPRLATPLATGLPYIAAEVIHAARNEAVTTIEDVMRRRLQIYYEVRDGGLSIADEIVRMLAAEEGFDWSDADREEQLQRYAAMVRASRPVPPR